MNKILPGPRWSMLRYAKGLAGALQISLAVTGIAASSSVWAGNLTDTGLRARKEVFWLDNDRVLFPGYDSGRVDSTTATRSPQSVLYIWDMRTRTVSAHADIPEGDYVCYSNGYMSYAVRKDGKRYIREGRIGAETEREWVRSQARSKVDRNEITCKDFDYSGADKIYPGFVFIPLLDGDGYYGWSKKESASDQFKAPMYYLPHGKGKKPIALPIVGISNERVSYSAYLKAYVVEYTPSHQTASTEGRVWILYPTGKVTESAIPAGPWMRGSMQYVPAREGMLMSSRALGFKSRIDPGHAGIYLVRGQRVELVLSGFPGRMAVSPDGCKVAAVINPRTEPAARATLQIVDLCVGGKTSDH